MIIDLERRWQSEAKCTGQAPDVFFPPSIVVTDNTTEVSDRARQAWDGAKKICNTCPVWRECARDFLGEVDGVWGGLDPLERRYLRRLHSYRLREKVSDQTRMEYARLAKSLHDPTAAGRAKVARLMGVTTGTVAYLLEWYDERVKPEAKTTVAVSTAVVDTPLPKFIEWPDTAPDDGDGWVFYEGNVIRARYLGETGDGEWYYMKAQLSDGQMESRGWFKAEDVHLSLPVTKTIKRRTGGVSRIYGTLVSTGEAAK